MGNFISRSSINSSSVPTVPINPYKLCQHLSEKEAVCESSQRVKTSSRGEKQTKTSQELSLMKPTAVTRLNTSLESGKQ